MTDSHMPDGPDFDLAAELALDLLTGAEKARALRLQLSDPLFAAEVTAWRKRLSPLFADYLDVPAPTSVWNRAVARIQSAPDVARNAQSLKKRLRAWKTATITASMVAAGLAFVVFQTRLPLSPIPAAPPTLAMASLVGRDKDRIVTLVYDPTTRILHISSSGLSSDATQPELWAIGSDGKPRSLGLITANGTSRLSVPNDVRPVIVAGTTMAVTMEEAATAPHQAPGSTPILIGKISLSAT